jgi:hypothetical protein
MKIILTIGHQASGFENIQQTLVTAGLAPAHPCRREKMSPQNMVAKLLHACNADSGSCLQLTPGKLWNELLGDLLMANLDQGVWGWADSALIRLMGWLADYEPEVRFVLSYCSPELTLAHTQVGKEISKDMLDQCLTDWANYNEELLRFFYRNKDRCLLVNTSVTTHVPILLLTQVEEQFGISLNKNAVQPIPLNAKINVAAVLARHLLTNRDELNVLYQELEAASSIVRQADKEEVFLCSNAWDSFGSILSDNEQAADQFATSLAHERQQYENHAEKIKALEFENVRVLAQSEEKLTKLQQENEANAQETELLLLQLHQVQEELESNFLQLNEKKQKEAALNTQVNSLNKQVSDKAAEATKQLAAEKSASDKAIAELTEKLTAAQKASAQQADQVKKLEAELSNAKSAAVSQDNLAKLQRQNKEQAEENELLLLQLHQVQEELENYFLKCQELEGSKTRMPSISKTSIISYPLQAITVDMRDEIPGNNWYHAEVDGRWAGPGLVSTVQLPVLANGEYQLELDVADAMAPEILGTMEMLINNQPIPWDHVVGDYPMLIQGKFHSQALGVADNWTLTLQFKQNISPMDQGSDDDRQLAIRLRSVRLTRCI